MKMIGKSIDVILLCVLKTRCFFYFYQFTYWRSLKYCVILRSLKNSAFFEKKYCCQLFVRTEVVDIQ